MGSTLSRASAAKVDAFRQMALGHSSAILARVVEKISGYVIGPAGDDALASLPDIERAAAEIFAEEDLPASMREHALPLAFFEAAAREGRLFVATEVARNIPVGFALTTRVDGCTHLYEMDVLPDHGRQGLGRRLVEAVADRARARGDARVTLTTFRHVAWNASFYRKLGFVMLDGDSLGPELTACLEAEVRRGLDPAKRVAMQLALRIR